MLSNNVQKQMTERIIQKIQEVVDHEQSQPQSASAQLEKIDEVLIVKALRSNNYDQQDIIKLNKMILQLDKPVPAIRIQIYEMRGDFVEAFKQHFSN